MQQLAVLPKNAEHYTVLIEIPQRRDSKIFHWYFTYIFSYCCQHVNAVASFHSPLYCWIYLLREQILCPLSGKSSLKLWLSTKGEHKLSVGNKGAVTLTVCGESMGSPERTVQIYKLPFCLKNQIWLPREEQQLNIGLSHFLSWLSRTNKE